MTTTYAGLSKEELAQRMCLLDLLEEIAESYGSADEIENRLGMRNLRDSQLDVRVHELSDEQLKHKVDEELERRTAELLADDFNDATAMIEAIQAMEAESEDEDQQPTIREDAHDMTNLQLRQVLDQQLQAMVRRLREGPERA